LVKEGGFFAVSEETEGIASAEPRGKIGVS